MDIFSGAFMGFDSEEEISDNETDVERATAVRGNAMQILNVLNKQQS
jgi:hypothetical protein